MRALHLVIAALFAVAASACGDDSRTEKPAMERGLIVIGVDGMDPKLLDRMIREGRTPNLAALAERGSYMPLGTSNPPQSPVAWSTFITGMDPGGHGIYDFVHRDLEELAPAFSTAKAEAPEEPWCVFGAPMSLDSGGVELLRRGRAFWQFLEDAGVPATVVKLPANFPPVETEHAESLSGMGTVDLLGTQGTFQLFTTDSAWKEKEVDGGFIEMLDFAGGQTARASLHGPPVDLCAEDPEITMPLEVSVDKKRPVALVRLGDSEVVLEEGEWSEWVPIAFDAGMVAGEVPGMVRLYLRSVRPEVYLYVSPINLDPRAPAMPISSPPHYAEGLAEDIGRYYTQNMPEDTKALTGKVLTDDEFLAQAEIVLSERKEMLDRELDRFRGGFLFFYFSSTDQVAHQFYGSLHPEAPEELRRYAHVLPDLYEKVDGVIGEVLERAGDRADVLIMSDHGFSFLRRRVHLNTWLAQEGYLELAEKPGKGALGHIDWASTQAYGLGLNQLFVNLQGREPQGVVPPEEKELLLQRLERELLSLRDPDTGARVVTRVERPSVGPFADRAPDLLVGYNRGYGTSDESAIGQVTGGSFVIDNDSHWNGDHCMDPAHVPGVLLSTRKLGAKQASLVDLAPTILSYFDLPRPEGAQGEILWDETK